MSDSLLFEATNAYVGYHQNVTTQVGAWVARERLARGMTQADLARASNLSASLVAQIEQGRKTRPTKDTLRKLARGLGLRYIDLLVGSGEVDPEDLNAPAPPPAGLAVLISRLERMSEADWRTVGVFLTALESRSPASAPESHD